MALHTPLDNSTADSRTLELIALLGALCLWQGHRIARLERERTLIFSALSNSALTLSERVVGVFTAFHVAYNRAASGDVRGGVPVCLKAIASTAGVSDDTVGKGVKLLAAIGQWSKEKTPLTWDSESQRYTSTVVLKTPDTLEDTLRGLARVQLTEEERKEVTGQNGKPRGRHGGKRIKRTCPECGSDDTDLRCRNCGAVTHTDLIVRELDDNGTEPQVAAHKTSVSDRPGQAEGAGE